MTAHGPNNGCKLMNLKGSVKRVDVMTGQAKAGSPTR